MQGKNEPSFCDYDVSSTEEEVYDPNSELYDILCYILAHVDLNELLNLRLTCTLMNKMIQTVRCDDWRVLLEKYLAQKPLLNSIDFLENDHQFLFLSQKNLNKLRLHVFDTDASELSRFSKSGKQYPKAHSLFKEKKTKAWYAYTQTVIDGEVSIKLEDSTDDKEYVVSVGADPFKLYDWSKKIARAKVTVTFVVAILFGAPTFAFLLYLLNYSSPELLEQTGTYLYMFNLLAALSLAGLCGIPLGLIASNCDTRLHDIRLGNENEMINLINSGATANIIQHTIYGSGFHSRHSDAGPELSNSSDNGNHISVS